MPRRSPAATSTPQNQESVAQMSNLPNSARVRVLADDGNALARADAATDGAIAGVPFPQFGRQCQHVSSTGRAERMADGNRAAIRGQLVVGNPEAAELIWQLT